MAATLGLAIAPPSDRTMTALLRVLRRWAVVRQAEPGDDVDAWLVTDATDPAWVSPGRPVLVWTRDASAAATRWGDAGILVVPRGPRTEAPANAIAIPEPHVDTSSIPFVAPLLRDRWRRSLGLPAGMVTTLSGDADGRVTPRLRPTALAVAAVAVARGGAALTAMAWGAPTVTDESTADRLGIAGCVAVAASGREAGTAASLAADPVAMAALAWRARTEVESRFDLAAAAASVARAAGLMTAHDPSGGVVACLEELRASPSTARAVARRIATDVKERPWARIPHSRPS